MRVEIRPVASRRDLRAFVELPWRLYRNDPLWVPPLRADVRRRLDRRRNPFFEHAEAEYFLAWRGGEVVGRVSAHVDRHLNEFQGNAWGLFGFYESEDDPEVTRALLEAAASWLRARGRDRMVGPMDFTTNDEVGVLLEGRDESPSVLCPYTAAYYPALIEAAGFGKAMDVLMYDLAVTEREKVMPILWELAEQVESRHGIVVRPMRKSDLEAEVGRFLEVYNAAWERNWGFVPLTEAEVRHYARELKPILDENWAYLAEKDGEVVGAALSLPDYNQVLKHLDGRLLPFGWVRFLRLRKRIDRVRVFALGVKPEYQHTGVAAKFYECHFDAAERTPQKRGELGWVLETNEPMNRAMEAMGATVSRRYRVYERVL